MGDLSRKSNGRMERKKMVTGKSAKSANQDVNMVEKNANVLPVFIYGKNVSTTMRTNLKKRKKRCSSHRLKKLRTVEKKF